MEEGKEERERAVMLRALAAQGMDISPCVHLPARPEAVEAALAACRGLKALTLVLEDAGQGEEGLRACVSLARELAAPAGLKLRIALPAGEAAEKQEAKEDACGVLKSHYGLSIPERMREAVEKAVRESAGRLGGELAPAAIYQVFDDHFVSARPLFQIGACQFRQDNGIAAEVTMRVGESTHVVMGSGNGRLDAVSNAIKNYFSISYELSVYEEHSLTRGSSSKAVAYVGVACSGSRSWGAGIDNDIIRASIEALTVAVNRSIDKQEVRLEKDRRMVEIMNFIQANYLNVTLERLSSHFYLSKPYLSKYIKEKSGMTFGELVKRIRMKKARTLLKTSTMTVESIALAVGYQNVEHFNRLFKKSYQMTPVQYRNQSQST